MINYIISNNLTKLLLFQPNNQQNYLSNSHYITNIIMGNQPVCGAICDSANHSNQQDSYQLNKIYTLPSQNSYKSQHQLQKKPTLNLSKTSSLVKPITVELPPLLPQVQEVYQRQKPFQQQFLHQDNIQKLKIDNDIYHGPLDQNGKPTKIGKLYKANGALLIATFVSGVAQGRCFYIMTNGAYYRGQMKNNIAECESNGQFASKTVHYVGGFKNNVFDGQGQEKSQQKNYSFKGTYKNGRKVQGTMKWREKEQDFEFKGNFDENGQFLKGIYTDSQGTYDGQFVNGKKHGHGIYHFKSKLRYQGQYFEGKKHGLGQIVNFDGSIAYKGTFENGMPHGKGIATSRTGQVFEAHWDHGIDIRHLSEK